MKNLYDTTQVLSGNLSFANSVNFVSLKITKWSNTLKQFVGKLPTNCFSVFDHFVGLALKGLMTQHLTLP